MKIIADSGATKTEWAALGDGRPVWQKETQGINPFHQTPQEIECIIRELAEEMPDKDEVTRVELYGAGCALPEKQAIVAGALSKAFPEGCSIRVESDLLGAAKAVCQGRPGICCILGTGSNSCQFDGESIVANTPPLGYILGDEGSGASLGRTLVADCLKGLLPAHLCTLLQQDYGITQQEVLERVYRRPLAARYLAGFTPFLSRHRHEPAIHRLLVESFQAFFRRNVRAYDTTLPVHFVGSIAHFFQEEVAGAARSEGLTVGRTLRRPMEGLIKGGKNEEGRGKREESDRE